ncbi:hypothetical protein QYM36_012573 [Artemia franciscana]|uniref:Serine/threonine-protein kinase 1 n=1 Tax=Artemia franciscana TaxID=6661 RepID=A0AA88L374_ARTSF|nr:hypothetical protein QYM36_012573 [Artemia franciscana]
MFKFSEQNKKDETSSDDSTQSESNSSEEESLSISSNTNDEESDRSTSASRSCPYITTENETVTVVTKNRVYEKKLYEISLDSIEFNQKYELSNKYLTRGSYGSIHLGMNKVSNKKVAVKIIPRLQVLRFYPLKKGGYIPLEVEIMRRLRNVPGCIDLLDVYDMGHDYWLITPYVEPSENLRQFIKSDKINSETQARFIFSKIVVAVISMHYLGIVHRDIKTANVIIYEKSNKKTKVKLIDFGSATFIKTNLSKGVHGTVFYYPPEFTKEQIYHPESASVWALGMLLFELLIKEQLETKDKILEKLLETRELTDAAKDLVTKCLKENYKERISLKNIIVHQWFPFHMRLKIKKALFFRHNHS